MQIMQDGANPGFCLWPASHFMCMLAMPKCKPPLLGCFAEHIALQLSGKAAMHSNGHFVSCLSTDIDLLWQAQTPVACKGPAVDYKRSLAASAPVFKQAEAAVGQSSHKHDVALLYSLVK